MHAADSELVTGLVVNRLPKDTMARQAAKLRKAVARARKANRRRRGVAQIGKPAGPEVVVVVVAVTPAPRTPAAYDQVFHPKRDAEAFENSTCYGRYARQRPAWETAARVARA